MSNSSIDLNTVYLVNRKSELLQLHDAYKSVLLSNRPKLLFVNGDFGLGKTALIETFIDEVSYQDSNVIICRGLCVELTSFSPFTQLLADLVEQSPNYGISSSDLRKYLLNIAPAWLELLKNMASINIALASSVQVVQSLVNGVAKTNEEYTKLLGFNKFSQDNVFFQYVNALKKFTDNNKKPVIAFIDNLHVADLSSLQLLNFILQKLTSANLLIICAYRPVEAGTAENALYFNTMKSNLIGSGAVEIELSRSTCIKVADYIKIRYRINTFSEILVAKIQKQSDGHPLYIQQLFNQWEIARIIVSTPDPYGNHCWWVKAENSDVNLSIPKNLGVLLKIRVEYLNNELKEILREASVEGDEFTAQVTEGIFQAINVPRSLEILQNDYLLVLFNETEDLGLNVLDYYKFTHQFFREIIYKDLQAEPELLRSLHKKVGDCLELLKKDQISIAAAQLADHYSKAHEWQKAVRYAIDAAAFEHSKYANNESQKWCLRALEWINKLQPGPERDRLEINIYEQYGYSFYTLGHYKDAEYQYQKAINLAYANWLKSSSATDAERLGELIVFQADTLDYGGKDEESKKLLRLGDKVLKKCKIPFGLTTFQIQSLLAYMNGTETDTAKYIKKLELLISRYKSIPLSQTNYVDTVKSNSAIGYSLILLGVLLSDCGLYNESNKAFREGENYAKVSKNKWLQEMALVNIADDYQRLGKYELCLEMADEAIKLAEEIGDSDTISVAKTIFGDVYLGRTEYKKAEVEFLAAIDAAIKIGAKHYLSHMYAGLALSYLGLGLTENALTYAESSIEAAEAADDEFEIVYCLDTQARIYLAKQDWDHAKQIFYRAINIHPFENQTPYSVNTLVHFAEALGLRKEDVESRKMLIIAFEIAKNLKLETEINKIQSLLN